MASEEMVVGDGDVLGGHRIRRADSDVVITI